MATWRELMAEGMSINGDTGPIVACTLDKKQMTTEFDKLDVPDELYSFFAWTPENVYFGFECDGVTLCSYAPRNPRPETIRFYFCSPCGRMTSVLCGANPGDQICPDCGATMPEITSHVGGAK